MKKSLGQHFLIRHRVAERIVQALELQAQDSVLEIGPGEGALTRLLAGRAASLLLVEKDRELAAALRETFRSQAVEVLEADFLTLAWSELSARLGPRFKIVSNLPYNVGTAIFTHLLRHAAPETCMVLMFQKEVGERLLAMPGTKAYGSLSVFTRIWAEGRALGVVPPQAFRPPPKVESLVVKFQTRPQAWISAGEMAAFEAFLRLGFGQRRKMLRHNLRADPQMGKTVEIEAKLEAVGASPQARAEELSAEQWVQLFHKK